MVGGVKHISDSILLCLVEGALVNKPEAFLGKKGFVHMPSHQLKLLARLNHGMALNEVDTAMHHTIQVPYIGVQ